MALSISALPPGFSWLRATYRPSSDEIAAYAEVIALAEGQPDLAHDSRVRDEAELQLWIWRTETRSRPPRARRPRHGAVAPLAG